MLTNEDKIFLEKILEKYSTGTCTPAEHNFIQDYFNYVDDLHKDKDPFHHLSTDARSALQQEIKARLLNTIHNTTPAMVTPINRRSRFYWRAAAAVIFIVFGAAAVWFFGKPAGKESEMIVQQTKQGIPPGSDRAVLKMADGKKIILDSAYGAIVHNGNLVVKNNNGLLNYEGDAGKVEYHTLSVPRGGHYKLQLPDGTDVWLNAASSITFPTAFTGNERKVEITGEAYFEVAKLQHKPFKVKMAGDAEIEVLGTHFNVNAYADETAVRTTLLEGSVQFKKATEQYLLQPGQQAMMSKQGIVDILTNVDTEAIMAWKNGYFNFDHADIQMVMRQLERWYDVQVEYRGKLPDMQFSGEISKNNNASIVLKILEGTGVHFTIEANKIIVEP